MLEPCRRRCSTHYDILLEPSNQSDTRQSHQASKCFNTVILDASLEVDQLVQATLSTVAGIENSKTWTADTCTLPSTTAQLSTGNMEPEYTSISFKSFEQANEAVSTSFNPFEQADDPFSLQSKNPFSFNPKTFNNSNYGKVSNSLSLLTTVSMENSSSFNFPSHCQALPISYNLPSENMLFSNSPNLAGSGQVQTCNM